MDAKIRLVRLDTQDCFHDGTTPRVKCWDVKTARIAKGGDGLALHIP